VGIWQEVGELRWRGPFGRGGHEGWVLGCCSPLCLVAGIRSGLQSLFASLGSRAEWSMVREFCGWGFFLLVGN